MLDIRINETPLDLPSGASINIVSANPILDKDNLARQFSYPFKVPLTPANLRARRHGQRLDAQKIAARQPGAVRFQSHLIAKGYVTQLRRANDNEEIAFSNEVLDLWKTLGEFKISELLETVQIGNPVYTEAVWTYTFTATFPNTYGITMDGVTATASAATSGDLDTAISSIASQINAVYPGTASNFPGDGTIKLQSSVINEHPVTSIASVTLTSVVTPSDKNYANIVNHVDAVNTTPVDTHCFPLINWNGLYTDGGNYRFEDLANNDIDGTFRANEPSERRTWYNTIIPCVRVPYILEKIRERVGFSEWRGDVFDGEAIQDLIVVSNYTLDDVRYDRYSTGALTTELLYNNGFKTEINLNRHVPEITAADFIRRICATFNLMLEYADGGLKFLKKKDRFDPPAFRLTEYIGLEYSMERNYTDGWTLRYTANDLEEFDASPHLQELVSGAGEVVTEVPATFGYTTLSIDGANVKMPITQQPGVSDAYDGSKGKSSLPLTFLFDRGTSSTSGGNDYQFASHDNINTAGGTVGNYSLDIQSDNGLYALWHKNFIELSNADTIRIQASLPLGALQKILQFSTARGYFYHPAGTINGVFKSLEYAISADGIAPVSIEMLVQ